MRRYIISILVNIILTGIIKASDIFVQGRVISSDDSQPIPGVNITVKNKAIGTATDASGLYSIIVPVGTTLVYSSIGYLKKEVKISDKTFVTVILEPDVTMLDETVVVGYGQQKKASIVGAISNIDTDRLKMAAPSNLTGNIAGQVAGALVRMGDGNIGGGTNKYSSGTMDDSDIFIRGRATPNSAQPLILVDGVESSFSRINPEDVAQFSVLKDASATAVYGVRGANGVILITTKRGVLGKPKIVFNSQVKMHQPIRYPKPLGAYDYATLYNEALKNVGAPPMYSQEDLEHWRLKDDPYGHPDVSFYDEIVKDFFLEHQHSLSLSGGTESVKYYISGEYNHADGPFKAGPRIEPTYDRYNLRTNFDFNLTKSTQLSVSLNGRLEDKGDIYQGESTGDQYYGSFWYAIISTNGHLSPIKNPNGTWAFGSNKAWNSIATLKEGGYLTRSSNSLDSRFSLKQDLSAILEGLSFRAMFGTVNGSAALKTESGSDGHIISSLWDYNPTTGQYIMRKPEATRSYTVKGLEFSRRLHLEASIDYNKVFAKSHKLTVMATYMQTSTERNYAVPISLQGVSGRVTYDYQSKYLAEINAGYNGSDQFSKENRYAFLPAVSLGWVLSEENFIKNNLLFLNFLKIRASHGTAGNDKIGSYRHLYIHSYNDIEYRFTRYWHELYNFGFIPSKQYGIQESTLGNDNVSWEIAEKSNLGLDMILFNKKLKFSGDIFYEKRSNILVKRSDLPNQTGLNQNKLPAQNLGIVTNKGVEFSLNWRDKIGNFEYSIGGNYTFARSNIENIAEVTKQYPYQMHKNHPVGQSFGYIWTGKFYDFGDLTNPEVPKPQGTVYPGDLMFEDRNKDGIINDLDIGAIGHPSIPEIVFGLNLSLSFKNIYLHTFWQGASRVSSRYSGGLRDEFSPNVLPIHLDRWVYDPERGLDTRSTAKYPSLIIGGSQLTLANSTFQLLDSEYLRLKSVELGYMLPVRFIQKMRIKQMKVFLSGFNLITFDHIKYIDPEYSLGQGWASRGNYYPPTRFYSIGISVGF